MLRMRNYENMNDMIKLTKSHKSIHVYISTPTLTHTHYHQFSNSRPWSDGQGLRKRLWKIH